MRIALFAYNFPHRKTQDFLTRLLALKGDLAVVLAADPVPLSIPAGTIRTKTRHAGLIHPREIAEACGVRYEVVEHNGREAIDVLQDAGADVGIISGARILKGPILATLPYGILNFHPGKIPEARGLDALLWSIYGNVDLGVSAHVIDHRIDAGRLVEWRPLPLYPDDTFIDLGERLIEIQTDMIPSVLRGIARGNGSPIMAPQGSFNRKMPPHLEREVERMLPDYLDRRLSRVLPEGMDHCPASPSPGFTVHVTA